MASFFCSTVFSDIAKVQNVRNSVTFCYSKLMWVSLMREITVLTDFDLLTSIQRMNKLNINMNDKTIQVKL